MIPAAAPRVVATKVTKKMLVIADRSRLNHVLCECEEASTRLQYSQRHRPLSTKLWPPARLCVAPAWPDGGRRPGPGVEPAACKRPRDSVRGAWGFFG
jgi:hypothetical protein